MTHKKEYLFTNKKDNNMSFILFAYNIFQAEEILEDIISKLNKDLKTEDFNHIIIIIK